MIKKLMLASSISILMLTSCSTNTGPEYDGKRVHQMKTIEMGVVIRTTKVTISDDGAGKSAGTMIGGLAGSAAGYNNGNFLATMGGAVIGGLVGGAVGKEAGKSNGIELIVDMDDGRRVVIVVEEGNFESGDRVEIIKNRNSIERVNKI